MSTWQMRASKTVASGLRGWAAGHGPQVQAAVALLVAHEVWLSRAEFHACCVHRDPGGGYWIDWVAASAGFDAGRFAGASPSELAVLDLAIALAQDRYRLGSMSTGKARLITTAVAAAAGIPLPRRPHLQSVSEDDENALAAVGEKELSR